MPGPRDNTNTNTFPRPASTGNLTADETLTLTFTKGNPLVAGLAVYVLVPQDSALDSLDVTLKCTTSGYEVEVTHTNSIDPNSTFPYILQLPFPPVEAAAVDWSIVLDVTDGGGGVNYGAVQVWLERAGKAKVDA